MMKKIFTLAFLTFLSAAYSQQIEFGAFAGYGFNNIVDTRIKEGKAVIGNAYWDVNKGAIVTYYFKTPDRYRAKARLNLLYRNETKGSNSENFSESKYEYNTNIIGLLCGAGIELGQNFLLYADLGLGYTMLDSQDIYKGNEDELLAFPLMEDYLEIKDNEVSFLFDLGLEKVVVKDRLKLFLEMNTNPSITRFNESKGKYLNQGIGFALGAKYFINLNKSQESTE